VLTLRGGPLIHDLSESKYPVTVLEDQNKFYNRIIDRLLSIFIGQKVYKRGDVVLYFERLKRGRANYNIIYANTILSVKMGCMIKDKSEGKTKLIAHIHELKTNTKILVPDIYEYYQKVDKFIAVSDLVKEELINEWHISSDRIDVIYPTIPQNFNYRNVTHPSSNIIQIGFAGYVHWNKGYDLFIQAAYNFRKKYPAITAKFRWIGSIDQDKRLIVQANLKKAGLNDYVFF
jgi:glycosyltransferase involved in cell wall biosynthesis